MPAFLSNLAKDFRGIYKTALDMKDETARAITSHADTDTQTNRGDVSGSKCYVCSCHLQIMELSANVRKRQYGK